MSVKDRVIAKVMGREYVAAKTVDILPTEVVVDAALVGAYSEGYDQGMEDAMNEVDRIAETTLLKHIHNTALQLEQKDAPTSGWIESNEADSAALAELEQKIVNGDSTIVNPVGVLNAESEDATHELDNDDELAAFHERGACGTCGTCVAWCGYCISEADRTVASGGFAAALVNEEKADIDICGSLLKIWNEPYKAARFQAILEEELEANLETVLNPDTRAIHFDDSAPEQIILRAPLSLEDARKAAKEYVSREVKQDIFTDADWDVTNDSQIAHDHVDQLTSTDNAWTEHRSVATHTVQPDDDRLVAYELGISVQAYRHFNERINNIVQHHEYFRERHENRIEVLEGRLI